MWSNRSPRSKAAPSAAPVRGGNATTRDADRDAKDERHICPLQFGTIERCVRLWSNPGELIVSPFAGIGSEGYEAVRLGRRYLGIELKPSYYRVACSNLATAETLKTQGSLVEMFAK